MVKTLGIDLEEDRGDVIGLDVQDKVNKIKKTKRQEDKKTKRQKDKKTKRLKD